ncbi:hypothetical protein MTR_0196s0030 [Medicago truncatula]|uniref:Uncharacterized protein n=1 Tax=Medicago truncatula TaxID=3880 RepID=A0A072TFV3_MEDTR|nr:hypothetical protein MTR_0196s0030 [Medicago truncatula]
MEIVDPVTRRKIKFMCQQETKGVVEKEKELDSSRFKHWYTGKVGSINGVGLEEYPNVKFWKDLKGLIQDIPQEENIFLGGGLNGHERVGVYLPKSMFTHGQLYVTISRVTSRKGLKLLILDEDNNVCKETTNVVYRESKRTTSRLDPLFPYRMMRTWSVLFDDVVFDDGVDKISNIPLMSKIFDDDPSPFGDESQHDHRDQSEEKEGKNQRSKPFVQLRRWRRHPWAAGHHAGGTSLTGEDEDLPLFPESGERREPVNRTGPGPVQSPSFLAVGSRVSHPGSIQRLLCNLGFSVLGFGLGFLGKGAIECI